MEFGVFEWQLIKYVKGFCSGASVAYDIGSAEGYYTLAFMKEMGENGRVCAFEADPRWIYEINDTLVKNGLIDRVQVFCGFVADHDDGQMLSIDHVVAEKGLPLPDIVKIDIEGAELKALEGMRRTLSLAMPKIILEVHSASLEDDCLTFLSGHGYTARIIDVGLGRLFPEFRPAAHNRWIVACKAVVRPYSG